MSERLILLVANTGGGHRAAAASVAEELAALRPDLEVDIVDPFLRSSRGRVVALAFRLYGVAIRRWPSAWGFVYRMTNSPTRSRVVERSLAKAIVGSVTPDPASGDSVVGVGSFHALTTELAAVLAHRVEANCISFTFVADPVAVHAAWANSRVDLTFVSTAEAAKTCAEQLVSQDGLHMLGSYPVRRGFDYDASGESRLRARAELGLSPEGCVITVTGGAEGAGRLVEQVKTVLATLPAATCIVLAGRNRLAKRRLARLANRQGGTRLRTLSWTNNFATLVQASDVVITKAGPNTLAECAAAGVPALVTSFVPGQEHGNYEWARSCNGVTWCPTPARLSAALRRSKGLRGDAFCPEVGSTSAARAIATKVIQHLPEGDLPEAANGCLRETDAQDG